MAVIVLQKLRQAIVGQPHEGSHGEAQVLSPGEDPGPLERIETDGLAIMIAVPGFPIQGKAQGILVQLRELIQLQGRAPAIDFIGLNLAAQKGDQEIFRGGRGESGQGIYRDCEQIRSGPLREDSDLSFGHCGGLER